LIASCEATNWPVAGFSHAQRLAKSVGRSRKNAHREHHVTYNPANHKQADNESINVFHHGVSSFCQKALREIPAISRRLMSSARRTQIVSLNFAKLVFLGCLVLIGPSPGRSWRQ
jgi:hypothetical protein